MKEVFLISSLLILCSCSLLKDPALEKDVIQIEQDATQAAINQAPSLPPSAIP